MSWLEKVNQRGRVWDGQPKGWLKKHAGLVTNGLIFGNLGQNDNLDSTIMPDIYIGIWR